MGRRRKRRKWRGRRRRRRGRRRGGETEEEEKEGEKEEEEEEEGREREGGGSGWRKGKRREWRGDGEYCQTKTTWFPLQWNTDLATKVTYLLLSLQSVGKD